MLHNKVVVSHIVKAVVITLLISSCMPSTKADEVDTLIQELKDKDSNVRAYTAKALVGIKDARAVEPLIAALKDNDREDDFHQVRLSVADALGEIGDKRAINPLIENLTDRDSNERVAKILSNMGWKPQTDRDRIHLLVVQHKGEELKKDWNLTKDVLLKDVVSHYSWTIENALYAFIAIGKREIIPVLIETLNRAGNVTMAEAYLNCGNGELDSAAREWASKHGYRIERVPGSASLSWGQW